MSTINIIFRWTMAHHYLTAGLLLLGGYAVYKLADKAIDVTSKIVDNAVEKGYTFEIPHKVRFYTQDTTIEMQEPT